MCCPFLVAATEKLFEPSPLFWRGCEMGGRLAPEDELTENLCGDWKSVGGGINELRLDYGPGYRVYYAQDGVTLILLLCGGTKRTQDKDIEKAHAYWKDYKARSG